MLDLEPLRCSEDGLDFGVEAEAGLGVEEALVFGAVDAAGTLGLDRGRLVVGPTPQLSLSLRWLLYELRLGSLYRSTVRTFP